MLLTACGNTQAQKSEALYTAPAWPPAVNLQMQSGVAKYITRGHSAYKACVANLETLQTIDQKGD